MKLPSEHYNIEGLSPDQVLASCEKFGPNKLTSKRQNPILRVFYSLVKEPMVLLLLLTSTIYFISGEISDAIFLACAILLVSAISLYQDSRSRIALDNLKALTLPCSKVIRSGKITEIKSEELVVGDFMVNEEGTTITADGEIVVANDFSVNESILTGESAPVMKKASDTVNRVYSGTTVTSGLSIARVTAVGNDTALGKIGKSIEGIETEKSPLEIRINSFVRKMVIAGGIIFLIDWIINFSLSFDLPDSLLKSLTLAMSILPEEIPVAFTTFMAVGAWRLMKAGVIVKQMKTVESLGSATVICVDKTGTITENKMTLAKVYIASEDKIINPSEESGSEALELVQTAMFASEPIPFDPMEVALHNCYSSITTLDLRNEYEMFHEYPLGGQPPMMTHIFKSTENDILIAAKGASEAITKVSKLNQHDIQTINNAVNTLSTEGYRVLGVARAEYIGSDFPEDQHDFEFKFLGLVAFYDPPKSNISEVLQSFYSAGISVKIITGDNAKTTAAIASQINFRGAEHSISGEALMLLSEKDLHSCVVNNNIFTRMFPDAKLRIINALKKNGEIVAMTGDGVNDGPALKAAHIGIAMGQKGTEIAKQASSLVLTEDDLSKMVDAIALGRRIHTNLKKAVQYIISIHIPIILTVFIPLALGWAYPNIFSPVHIIFLELIMGPTCSIVYENEPLEKNAMQIGPKEVTKSFFNARELRTSILQGLVISAGSLAVYQYGVQMNHSEELTRTMVFITLISANIFLTLVNRSFYSSIIATLFYKNKLIYLMISITILLTAIVLYAPPVATFFSFKQPGVENLVLSVVVGFISVTWYEIVKMVKRKKSS